MKLEQIFEAAVVAQLDLPPACTVPEGTVIHAAIDKMKDASRSVVVIVDADDKVSGVFTEVDFVRKILGHTIGAEATIDEYMTAGPQTVTRDSKLSDAFELMSRRNFRHLPVVDSDNKPTALLAVRHLVQYIAERYPAEVLAMAPDVHQVTEADGG
jgi:CBS domain-containing protein